MSKTLNDPWRVSGFSDARSKLSREQQDAIRERYADGETVRSLAAEFKVHTATIQKYIDPRQPGRAHKLTEDQKQEIRDRRAAGETLASIGKAFDVSTSTIHKIVNGYK